MSASMQFSNHKGVVNAVRRASRHLRPPPKLAPSDWSEQNIKIPIGNAVSGLIRFANAPYQRDPIDMSARPDCFRISLMWSAQVGKTQTALCVQAFRIAQDPTSQIMMQPSEGDLKTWLETKFNPLVESNKQLGELIAKPRGRDGVNNQRIKSYPGGFMMFSWSGSPKTMRGRSAPLVICDETDGYDKTSEGHPVSLLWQRAATFGDQRLLFEISTPTFKGASHIESSFDQGDQRRFYVPCPHCNAMQTLKWQNVTWAQDEDGTHLPETARYTCDSCGVLWNDGERIAAIRNGEWIASKPFRGHASYHLNEMYSVFRKLSDIVQSFLDKKAANDLQTFVNVSLAETWEEEGEKVDAHALIERTETFIAPVPAGGVYLTAGVDMQTDRLELEVVAWGLGEESWSVDYKVLWGDPLCSDVWDDLDAYLSTTFLHESGAQLAISGACIDTGGTKGYTQAAYEYCRGKQGRKIFAVKGVGGWGRPIVTTPSRKKTGKKTRPVDLFTVGTDEAKLILSKRLGIERHGPGFCHFPNDREAEYFHQLTAEKLMLRYVKGFPVRDWHKTRERNEALDCRNYAYACLKILNPNLKRLIDKFSSEKDDSAKTNTSILHNKVNAKMDKSPEDAAGPETQNRKKTRPRTRQRKKDGSWVKRY